MREYLLECFEVTDQLERLSWEPDDVCREAMAKPLELLQWAREAGHAQRDPSKRQDLTDKPGAPMPRFPTGVSAIDQRTGGGGYGFTCVCAYPKCGKSMLAMSCALQAAADGWHVWYLNAELSEYEALTRVRNYLGDALHPRILDRICFYHTEKGMTIEKMLEHLMDDLCITDRKWLIIGDSINRLVKQSLKGNSENSYWRELEKWSDWFRMTARLSGGLIGSLVVSELNQKGHVKGGGIEYDADILIKIDNAEAEGDFQLSIPYARSSGGGDIGRYWLNWKRGRFERAGQM